MGGWGSGQSPAPPGTAPCSIRQTELSSECPAVSPAVEKHANTSERKQVEPRCWKAREMGESMCEKNVQEVERSGKGRRGGGGGVMARRGEVWLGQEDRE